MTALTLVADLHRLEPGWIAWRCRDRRPGAGLTTRSRVAGDGGLQLRGELEQVGRPGHGRPMVFKAEPSRTRTAMTTATSSQPLTG